MTIETEIAKTKKLSKQTNIRARNILIKQNALLDRVEQEMKKSDKLMKDSELRLKKNKESTRKMLKSTMWLGLIMGLVTITLVTFLIVQQFMSATPNALIIIIDLIGFGMAINLIYRSYQTRHELRKEMQDEILNVLEND